MYAKNVPSIPKNPIETNKSNHLKAIIYTKTFKNASIELILNITNITNI